MKILTVDIGTGTQDIFLYDSCLDIENGFKLILPSPTLRIFHQIQQATHDHTPILLSGVTMGGGPSSWAIESHLKAGLPVFATTQAAKTINDNLEKVADLGVTLVSEEEATALPDSIQRLEFKDFDLDAIMAVFTSFGVSLHDLAAMAVAVFDHGEAPHGMSDRKFRFDYLNARIHTRSDLRSFAYLPTQIPPYMTRLKAVVDSSSHLDIPLVVMDTAPAAILGATFDPRVSAHPRKLIANLGNFHTLAFRLNDARIEGVFEHHTGFLDHQKLESLLLALADGSLQNETVFSDQGHGALVYDHSQFPLEMDDFNLVVTGPRRSLVSSTLTGTSSRLRPYFATPFGDMMISGCFGLLAAVADLIPDLSKPIIASLQGNSDSFVAPWEIT